MHGLTGFTDIYPFGDDVDQQDPAMGLYDEMSAAGATHPSAYTKAGIQWLDRATIAEYAGPANAYALHAISLTQPPPTGRMAAVRIGTDVPYLIVEARLMADQFDAGIPKEGVIVYKVQTPDPLGHRVNHLRPLILKTPQALSVGQAFVSDDGIRISVTGSIPGGFAISVHSSPSTECPQILDQIASLQEDIDGESDPFLRRQLVKQINILKKKAKQLGCV